MPRVIRIEEPRDKQTKCECGAVVGYHADEVKSRHGTDYGGGPAGSEWISCPNVNREITLRRW